MIPPIIITITHRIELSTETLAAFEGLINLFRRDGAGPQASLVGMAGEEGGRKPVDVSSLNSPAAVVAQDTRPPVISRTKPVRNAAKPAKRDRILLSSGVWTEERIAALTEDWPAGKPVAMVHARLAAMEGAEIWSEKRIGIYAASDLGLRRPHGFGSPAVRARYAIRFAGVEAASLTEANDAHLKAAEAVVRPNFAADAVKTEQRKLAPVRVSHNLALRWGQDRQIPGPLNLPAINAKRAEMQQPPFVIDPATAPRAMQA